MQAGLFISKYSAIIKYDLKDANSTLLTAVKFKVLLSLKNHWDGLTVFIFIPKGYLLCINVALPTAKIMLGQKIRNGIYNFSSTLNRWLNR